MPDEDGKIFSEAFELYNKYRWHEIQTDEWIQLSNDIRDFAEAHQWKDNPLAKYIGFMLLDVFNELYKNGNKPAIPDYFGRSDLADGY